MKGTDKYWNPLLETLPQEKLKKLQLKKFQHILRFAYENSPFYRELYSKAGLEPGDIKTLEDIKKVPKTQKADLREAQGKDPYPYGSILAVPLEQVTEYRQTSGTTGQPVYHPETWQDWEWSAESWAYSLYSYGFRSTDRLFLPFGYSINIAFWAAHYAAEKIGAEVIPGGQLNTEARLLKMQELRPTAIAATPTYILGMADTARSKLGLDPRDLNIRLIIVAGEPGGNLPATRQRMEEAWGATVFEQAGATEIGHWGFGCEARSGLHVHEAMHLVELEDPETGETITESGRKGVMVFSTFDRYAHPCIRFDSKDVAEWAPFEVCECGRTFRVLPGGITGRADDITKVKGVLLAPAAIEEAVRSVPQLGDEFEAEVTKRGDVDEVALRVELLPEYEEDVRIVEEALARALRDKTGLRFDLEFRPYGSLPRWETKARRFKDLRKKER